MHETPPLPLLMRSFSLSFSLSLFRLRLQFVPDDLKDDKYWARRRKNNMAAKRSRDARRMKENQIALRAGFLEKEVSFSHDWKLEARNRSVNCRTYRCDQRVRESARGKDPRQK